LTCLQLCIIFCYKGKDNYVGEIKDDVFNETALDHDYKHPTGNQSLPRPPKNVAYYHR